MSVSPEDESSILPSQAPPTVSARRIAKGTLFNLLGLGIPLAVALATTPLLIRSLGIERYGVLMLLMAVVGYASLFDLGLGRSMTRIVALKLGSGEGDAVPKWSATGLVLLAIMGCIGALLFWLGSGFFFDTVIHLDQAMRYEIVWTLRIAALTIPFVILSAGLRGILEGYQDFATANFVRALVGIYLVVCPLFTALWTPNLVLVALSLLVGRIFFFFLYLHGCGKHVKILGQKDGFERAYVKPLITFGGWITVSGIVGPLMVTMDRLLLGALVSIEAVAYYTTAVDLVTRVLIVVSALGVVLFPVFSQILDKDLGLARLLYDRSISSVKVILFPIIFLIILFAEPFLYLWLGADFAAQSTLPMQILAVGVFVNGLANAPLNVIQGGGRPDITAKIHLAELAIYLPLLWFAVSAWGILGAAIIWSLRMGIDMLAMSTYAKRRVLKSRLTDWRTLASDAAIFAMFAVAALPMSIWERVLIGAVCLPLFALLAWYLILDSRGRSAIISIPMRLQSRTSAA